MKSATNIPNPIKNSLNKYLNWAVDKKEHNSDRSLDIYADLNNLNAREFNSLAIQLGLDSRRKVVVAYCELCGKALENKNAVWFEMHSVTHEVWEVDSSNDPPDWSNTYESQGCFAYGPDCAKKVRKLGKAVFKE